MAIRSFSSTYSTTSITTIQLFSVTLILQLLT